MNLYYKEFDLNFLGLTHSDKYVFNEIFVDDTYKKKELLKLIKDREVIEVGGHKGYFSILASTVASRVIVFEPNDLNFTFLEKNIDLNNKKNIFPIKKAVGLKNETREFNISNKTDARHSFFRTKFCGFHKKISVQCTTLKDIISDFSISNLSLVKIDCEGGEYEILFNLGEVSKFIPAIVCEIHESPEIPYTKKNLLDHMEKLGYKIEIYSERKMENIKLCMAYFLK